MANVATPKNFDASKLKFGKVKKNKDNDGKSGFVEYNGGRLCVQLNDLPVQFDLSGYPRDAPQFNSYKTWLSFREADTNDYVRRARDMMSAIDTAVLNAGFANRAEWGLKGNSLDAIDAVFNRTVATPDKKDQSGNPYPPRMAAKVTQRKEDGSFEVEVYNPAGERLDVAGGGTLTAPDVFKAGSRVTVVLECMSLYVVSGKLGLSWKVAQVRPTRLGSGGSHLPSGKPAFVTDDDVGGDKAVAPAQTTTTTTTSAMDVEDGAAAANDDDDDGEEEGDESDGVDEDLDVEPVPVPVATPAPKAKAPVVVAAPPAPAPVAPRTTKPKPRAAAK